MLSTLKTSWALLFGVVLLYMGSGMLYTNVVLAAKEAGFSTFSLGMMQSAYQVGWLVAALFIPYLIKSVGHIRVFAAVAALGSSIILLHLAYVNEIAWSIERFIMGVCTAGLMIVAESWLNDGADNRSRGQVLALYTILSWGAPVVGVWVLRFGDPSGITFFIAASVLISIAVVPMLITATHSPSFIESERLSLKKLYTLSPLGVSGTFLAGLCHGAFFASVAVFATAYGMSAIEISNITAIALLGGILVQWPVAHLSDRMDRRWVLVGTAGLGALAALYYAPQTELSVTDLYIAIGLISTMCLGLYSQCIAHANDHLTPQQVIPATGTLVLVYGMGYAISPFLAGVLFQLSPSNFFWMNGLLMAYLSVYVLWRMTRRAAVEDQGEMVPMASASPYAAVISAAEEWSEEDVVEQYTNTDAPTAAETEENTIAPST